MLIVAPVYIADNTVPASARALLEHDAIPVKPHAALQWNDTASLCKDRQQSKKRLS
jgi:hypothetical protein